ncbi:MAG: hypothetical protein IPJ14_00425 [Kineosporiaceae bacterium]|nr:hypothetical protein [Kineosporiaceae bacterium]MBK7621149.1 hypothetical protein [Kineosporiaceae bacterium]MBK8076002.1 hypothetical protein [Kineosporiaceae bacterium]
MSDNPNSTTLSPSGTPTPPPTTSRPPLRMRTVVVGLVALAVSITTLINQLTSIDIPSEAVTLAVLLGAGGLLLASGILAAIREQRVQHERSDPYGRP